MQPWSVRASRCVFEDRWIRVRADDCWTKSGHAIAPYYVLDYPDWVHVVALTPSRKIVLVRQYRHGVKTVTLGLPAGVMEAFDRDPASCGARELTEETGYAAEEVRTILSLSPNAATHSNRVHVVVATNARFSGPPIGDPTEEIEVVESDIAVAVAMALRGDFLQAMHVCSLITGLTSAGLLSLNVVSTEPHED